MMTNPDDPQGARCRLAEVIAAHLARWKTPHVELSIYGSGDDRDRSRGATEPG
jgi:hypothetical protein